MKVKDLILEITGVDFQNADTLDDDTSKCVIPITESLEEALEREVKVSHTPMFHEQISSIEEIKYNGEDNSVIIRIED